MQDDGTHSPLTSACAPFSSRTWTVDEVRNLTFEKLGKRPCWLQIQSALAVYAGKDVVTCAATGFGKTLTFWMPLLMAVEEGYDKLSIVVTPLNLLGRQNVEILNKAGLEAVAVDRGSVTAGTVQDIEAGKYKVVVINPELLLGHPAIMKLWTSKKFRNRILNFIFDEAHCISQWASFRKQYQYVGNLRYIINEKIPFYSVSATLPDAILGEISDTLRLRHGNTMYFRRSNDRPDIRLAARPLAYPAKSFKDLDFLIPRTAFDHYNDQDGKPPIQKFVVFFDNMKEAEQATHHLRCLLPDALKDKVIWFHSVMTQGFREEQTDAFRRSDIWGLCATDSFGMGMDLPDIEIIVQWKAICTLCSMWQRFGRGARGDNVRATAVLLFDKKDTSAEPVPEALESNSLKRKASGDLQTKSKRPALVSKSLNRDKQHDAPKIADGPFVEDGSSESRSLPKVEVCNAVEECRRRYAQCDSTVNVLKGVKARGKRQPLIMGSAMDNFINVEKAFNCRRKVVNVYFGNDKASTGDHYVCDPTQRSGCARCAPKSLTSCCDICNPEDFTLFFAARLDESDTSDTSDGNTELVGKSRLKTVNMTGNESSITLQKKMFEWRRNEAIKRFGAGVVAAHGSHLLMTDSTIERIVACAHAGRIPNLARLITETKWRKDLAEQHGPSLLSIIREVFPNQQLPRRRYKKKTDANLDAENASDVAALAIPSRVMRCRVCGQLGHNRRTCPVTSMQTENVPAPVQLPQASSPAPIQLPQVSSPAPIRLPQASSLQPLPTCPQPPSMQSSSSSAPSSHNYPLYYQYLSHPDWRKWYQ